MRKQFCLLAAGMLAGGALTTPAAAQQMVINEISIGDPEFVEILVTEDGDYEDWAVIDSISSGTIAGGGMFFDGPGFANLQAGTLITVYAESIGTTGANAEDLSYNPAGGDWDLTLFLDSATTGDFAVVGDTGMILGSGSESVYIGDGSPAMSPYNTVLVDGTFEAFTPNIGSTPSSPYVDPLYFRFGVARSASGPQVDFTEDDIDFPDNLDIAATGDRFLATTDYVDGQTTFTPGLPNTAGNETYILTLRGVSTDDPNIQVVDTQAFSSLTGPGSTSTISITVDNVGTANNLDVAGSTITGANAGNFSVSAEPTGIAPGASGVLEVAFDPIGATGQFQATLTINSNDQSGDTEEVTLIGFAGDQAPYAGLYIMELASGPTVDEFVEIENTTGAPIDVSGVIISDEETGTGEGACAFPAGTTLAAGERVVIALGTSDDQPTWLDSVPAGVRVFHEPARDPLAIGWFPANGNSIIAMDEVDDPLLGLSGTVFLAGSGDGVAMYLPSMPFSGLGVEYPEACIDGVNFNNTSGADPVPINPTGLLETSATYAGSGDAEPSIVRRLIQPNTDSDATFRIAANVTPGAINPDEDPNIFVSAAYVEVPRSLPGGSSQGALSVENIGATQNLVVSGSVPGGTSGALFSINTEPTVAPAGAGDLVIDFTPAGATGFIEASVTVNSNDGGGDAPMLPMYSFSADPADYANIWLSEVDTGPTSDEFVEIHNSGATTVDISGVQVTDSHDDNFEGCLAFPPGTTIGPGEFLVIACGNENVERPSWLDDVPGSVRVFFEPARADGAEFWFPANGNQLVQMINVAENEDDDGGILFLGSSDGVALMFPGARIFDNIGPVVASSIIDGVNLDPRVEVTTEQPMPINPTGQRDTQATRVGNPLVVPSVVRIDYSTNTASSVFWAVSDVISPGEANPTPSSVDDWTLMSY